MKYACNRCKKVFDEKDIIYRSGTFAWHDLFVYHYCRECYDEIVKREEKESRMVVVEHDVHKNRKWWQ